MISKYIRCYLKEVGNISVIKQSKAAFPQLITPEKTAETMRLSRALCTKYMPMAHNPAENVLKTVRGNNVRYPEDELGYA